MTATSSFGAAELKAKEARQERRKQKALELARKRLDLERKQATPEKTGDAPGAETPKADKSTKDAAGTAGATPQQKATPAKKTTPVKVGCNTHSTSSKSRCVFSSFPRPVVISIIRTSSRV